jgi:hypothetical protein
MCSRMGSAPSAFDLNMFKIVPGIEYTLRIVLRSAIAISSAFEDPTELI